MMALGADLVADDRVAIVRHADTVTMSAPPSIAGQIEARFVGILTVEPAPPTRLSLVVDMARPAEARLPQAETITILGCDIPLIPGADVPNLAEALFVLLDGPHPL